MSTTLIALAATAAALALTWVFCLRPMRRQVGNGRGRCCTPHATSTDDQLKAARQELAQLQAHRPSSGVAEPGASPAQNIDDQFKAARHELAQLQADRGSGTGTIPPRR